MMKNLLQDSLQNKLDARISTPSRRNQSVRRQSTQDKVEFQSQSKYDQITQKADDAEELLIDPDFIPLLTFGLTKKKGIGMIAGPTDYIKFTSNNPKDRFVSQLRQSQRTKVISQISEDYSCVEPLKSMNKSNSNQTGTTMPSKSQRRLRPQTATNQGSRFRMSSNFNQQSKESFKITGRNIGGGHNTGESFKLLKPTRLDNFMDYNTSKRNRRSAMTRSYF